MSGDRQGESPKSSAEALRKPDVRFDAALLSTEVQSEHYQQLIAKVDARFPQGSTDFFAGNVFKRHIKTEFQSAREDIPNALIGLETLLPRYIRMMDGVERKLTDEAFAKKLGIQTKYSPEGLAELARRNGVSSPEDMGLVKMIAMLRGVNTTLKAEYLSYLDGLDLSYLVDRYEELA